MNIYEVINVSTDCNECNANGIKKIKEAFKNLFDIEIGVIKVVSEDGDSIRFFKMTSIDSENILDIKYKINL